MRINRFLAGCGLGSRRKMDTLIMKGVVFLNGEKVVALGTSINLGEDVVTVNGNVVQLQEDKAVYLLNKPAGYLTTMSDPQGRKTVRELVSAIPLRLFPVGRLDMDTHGLLLFTNDGELSHHLAHPSYGVEKEYKVKVHGRITREKLKVLESGVRLDEGITSPARVIETDKEQVFHLVLHEGWKRQVRRMCEAVGLKVIQLTRVRYAQLTLEGVLEGELRRLTEDEVKVLKS